VKVLHGEGEAPCFRLPELSGHSCKTPEIRLSKSAFYHLSIPCNLFACFLSFCCQDYSTDASVSKAALFINVFCGEGRYTGNTYAYFWGVLNSVIMTPTFS
jgi:hypothetical protein